jgi:hypothetical protein
MAKYVPLYIKGMNMGLVQDRVEFILPNDAYPQLENAYVWRERILRKKGYALLGRLKRSFSVTSIGISGASPWSFNLFAIVTPVITEPNAEIAIGSIVIDIGTDKFTDQGNGTLQRQDGNLASTINYVTGAIVLVTTQPAGTAATATFSYYPSLPVMGIRGREIPGISFESTVFFDTKYAYYYVAGIGFEEFIPGTTWTGSNSDFFWTTNYWVDDLNQKIFWATNNSGVAGDPIRYTGGPGGAWIDFAPYIDLANTKVLAQCVAMLPFRSRMIAFNTLEGPDLATSIRYSNRIRWAAIGNPITTASAIVTPVNVQAWYDDVPGQGGYLDIPTSEDIVSVGYVRDNLVIFCERSTWQLRYTGRTIQPFQIEKVNTELGAGSTFSAIQFDTSLVGIGDKGIVQCDSFKSERIDIKIPDLVFNFNNEAQGPTRVQGVRDFINRLAFWTYPYVPAQGISSTYPNRRLVYNYENDSWAIFTDSLTALGTFFPQVERAWQDIQDPWEVLNFSWVSRPDIVPEIIGGNQQGYIEYLDQQVSNDISLTISSITGNTTTPTIIICPSHNLQSGQVIQISGIIAGTSFDNLNDGVFEVEVLTTDSFSLYVYNASTGEFSDEQLDPPGTYIGGGQIAIRDNFSIVSKKFNFLEEGQNIQMGFVDVLFNSTSSGEVTLNVYIDYNQDSPVNTLPQNQDTDSFQPDTFFNSVVLTSRTSGIASDKNWQRVFCPARGNFITLQWTLSNGQMAGTAQQQDVEIDAQILWLRKAGRQLVNA